MKLLLSFHLVPKLAKVVELQIPVMQFNNCSHKVQGQNGPKY